METHFPETSFHHNIGIVVMRIHIMNPDPSGPIEPEASCPDLFSAPLQYMLSHVSAVGPDFPTSLAGVRYIVQEMIASDCMVTVNFAEVRCYKLPSTVLIHTKNAIIQGLQRCTHLNGLKVEVLTRAEVSISAWAETRISSPEIPMLVRRVKNDGTLYGNLIRLDTKFIVPTVLKWDLHTMSMLQKMTSVWTPETRVIVCVHPEQLEMQRLSAEYWINSNKFCQASSEFRIVSATFLIDLVGLGDYIHTFDWNNIDHGFKLNSPAIVAKVSSFVDCRLTGTNLNVECAICLEPRRKYPHIRLGCVCGEVGSVKGAVLHLKCAMTWLLNQEKMWARFYDTHDQPSPRGMDSPSCPFCKSRLLGLAPDVHRIALHQESIHDHTKPSLCRLQYLKHMNFLLQARYSFPEALRRIMIPDTASMLRHLGPGLTQEMADTACISFPTAETLFLSKGDGREPSVAINPDRPGTGRKPWSKGGEEAAAGVLLPPMACSFPYQSDDVDLELARYNNMVYYIAVACELRYATQCQNARADRRV